MKQSEIKTECELINTQIESLNNRLNRLQSICKHPNTYEKGYSIVPAKICSDCNKVIYTYWDKLAEITSTDI